MADEVIDDGVVVEPPNPQPAKPGSDDDMIARLVAERTEAKLADIKSKLDNSFKARDEALARIAEFEKKEREATLKKLEEEGKTKEAFEMRLAEKEAALETLRKQNVELSRDVAVKSEMTAYSFRNNKAYDMAFKEIVGNLVQDANGKWVHRSGISIADYCDAFSKDEEQAFLFKAKSNSGGGSNAVGANGLPAPSNKEKSIFSMTTAEVLKLATEGKLKGQKR